MNTRNSSERFKMVWFGPDPNAPAAPAASTAPTATATNAGTKRIAAEMENASNNDSTLYPSQQLRDLSTLPHVAKESGTGKSVLDASLMLSAFVEDTKIQCRAIAKQIKANQEERALDDELHEQEVYLLERENNKLQEKINTLEHKMNTLKEEKEKLLTNEQKRSQEAEAEINNWKEKCEQLQERWDRAVKCFAS